MNKKIISAAIIASSVIGYTLTAVNSSADIQREATSFSVKADRTNKPSAYCRNSDGSPMSENYSSSGNFCICCCAKGNATIMSFDNDFAYCIGKHWQKAPTPVTQADKCSDIPFDQPEYAAVFSIAAAGASSGTTMYGLNSTDLYYVTQCAIRSSLYGMPAESLAFYDENGVFNENMTSEFMRLRAAETEIIVPDQKYMEINTEFSVCRQTMIDDKIYSCYGPFFPEVSGEDYDSYSVNLTSGMEYAFISDTQDASEILNTNNFSSNLPFFIYADTVYQEEISVNISTNVLEMSYEPLIYAAHDKTYQDIAQIHISQIPVTVSADLSVHNTDTVGNLQINKRFFSEGNEISDLLLISQPRFSVRHTSGKYVSGTLVNGHIVFDHFSDEPSEFQLCSDSTLFIENLPVGEYSICEVKGVPGYTAETPEILITNTSETDEIEFINTQETVYTETTACTSEIFTEEVTTCEETSQITESTTPTSSITTTAETEIYETESSTEEIISETEYTTTTSEIVTYKNTPVTYKNTPAQTQRRSYSYASSSPHTGESPYTVIAILSAMILSAATALKFKK